MRSFAGEVFAVLDTAHHGIAGASAALLEGRRFESLHHPWLRVLYQIICATTPLLRFGIARLSAMPETRFNSLLHHYFTQKLDDEAGHDRLLLADIERSGLHEAAIRHQLPSPAISAMLGAQYYFIDHVHPAAHLGYIGLLEGYAPSAADVAAIIEKSNSDPNAWSTYRMHGELDPDHRRGLEEMLDAFPRDHVLRRATLLNALRSAESYCVELEALAASP